MPRHRDDDDDDDRDDDDRPRRRRRSRRDDDPPKSNTGMILLIVGLAVGLPLLVCVGIGAWGFLEVKKASDRIGAGFEAEMAAEEFLSALSRNDTDAAYSAHTSAAYRASTTKEAFTKLVKANPVLTTDHSAVPSTYSPTPAGTTPNRTVTLTYTVEAFDAEFDDPDDPPGRPPGRPGRPNPAPPRTVTCTVVVAEQPNSSWKVDKFTIP